MVFCKRVLLNYAVPTTFLLLGLGCQSAEHKGTNTTDTPVGDTLITSNATIDDSQAQLEAKAIAFLRAQYKNDMSTGVLDSASRRFIVAEHDLNADGDKEIFIGLSGSYFCGSGGCTVLLLTSESKLLNTFTVVSYPVAAAVTTTNGWVDLVMSSNGKSHILKFNGIKYPSNPSIQPAIKFVDQAHQVILAPENNTKWLQF